MGTPYKRTRHTTSSNTWINTTVRANGTSSRSYSTKSGTQKTGTRTTNISSRGVTRTVNNNGWVIKQYIPAFSKPKKSSSKARKKNTDKLWKNTFSFLTKKKSPAKRSSQIPPRRCPWPAPKVEQKLYKAVDAIDMDKWSGKKQFAFVVIVAIICLIIQLAMR